MAKSARELAEIAANSVRNAAGLGPAVPKKSLPREPTEAMRRAAETAPMPITINDDPAWLSMWHAMWDAAAAEATT
jgi:hypothetical protein